MKFKTNHSPGPFTVQEDSDEHNCLILDVAGNTIAEQWSTSSDVVDASNIKLFKAAPAMLEYMMDRARMMSIYGFSAVENSELKRIMAILKDAGVNVVE